MRVLAIECSTDWLAVAAGDEASCRELREHALQSHSERVLPLVDALLAELGWPLASLDAIAFGAGPGSFTGIRIACGVAQGLALGTGRPVLAVATLEALAQDAHRAHGAARVVACLDARMREVYVGAYQREGELWREVASPMVTKPDAIVALGGAWFGAGTGFAAYPGLATMLATAGSDDSLVPSARSVVELALPRLADGQGVDAAHALPLYVRHRVALTTDERARGAKL